MANRCFRSREIFFLCGLATVPVFIYIILLIPQATIKFLAWLATHSLYKIRVYSRENIPEQGGAILVPNHISWLDGLLLFATSSRQIRMLIDAELIDTWRAHGFAKMMGAIPIKPSPKSTRRAIETAREALQGRRARVHFSGRRHQPLGPIAALQAGRAGNPARHRRADHSRVSRRAVGQHLQLSRRQVFLEMAHDASAASFDLVRQADSRTRATSTRCGKPCRTWAPMPSPAASSGTAALPRAMIRNCRKAMFRSQALRFDRRRAHGRQAAGGHARHAAAAAAARARAGR